MEIKSDAQRLEYVIELTGLKQGEFAARLGVSPAAISHIMSPNGRHADLAENLADKILQVFPELGLSRSWLLTGLDDNSSKPGEVLQPGLFDHIPQPTKESNAKRTPSQPQKAAKDDVATQPAPTQARTVKQIIFFYSDGSFEAFHPDEN